MKLPVALVATNVAPLSKLKEVPPVAAAVSTAEAPAQMVALLKVGTGRGLTVTAPVAVAVQPVALVTRTV